LQDLDAVAIRFPFGHCFLQTVYHSRAWIGRRSARVDRLSVTAADRQFTKALESHRRSACHAHVDGLSALLRSAASGLLLYARQPEVEPDQLRAPPSLRSSEPPRCPVRRPVEICRGPWIQDSFFLASWPFGFDYKPLPSSPANRLV
jgi:hypothetical protein